MLEMNAYQLFLDSKKYSFYTLVEKNLEKRNCKLLLKNTIYKCVQVFLFNDKHQKLFTYTRRDQSCNKGGCTNEYI